MHPVLRLIGIAVVFGVVAVGWVVFGAVMLERTNDQSGKLHGRVADLWGSSHVQQAPGFTFEWDTERDETSTEQVGTEQKVVHKTVRVREVKPVNPASTQIDVDLSLDQRLKGLMWYALYDVSFQGGWTYTHRLERSGELRLGFSFPDAQGLYDDFRFVVNGVDRASELSPKNGSVSVLVPVEAGQTVTLEVGYNSRGMSEWLYSPAVGVANLENFKLSMQTDFQDIDFPNSSMSPSNKTTTDKGWSLSWDFKQVITGHGVGVVMPQRIQPGELAASLSFSAPISLFFFFLVLYVLGTIRRIDIHPINYLFLGAAFFAFHLLFGYSVDHLSIVPAFVLASVVSIILVVTYLRLVVSARFACVEAAAAQLVYLVGFSLAHFWDGFTGLMVTVLAIITLFLVMQWTGRVKWSEVLMRQQPAMPNGPGASQTGWPKS